MTHGCSLHHTWLQPPSHIVTAAMAHGCSLHHTWLQVPFFVAACKCYCNVLNVIGPFTLLTVREVNANMAKIETSLQVHNIYKAG